MPKLWFLNIISYLKTNKQKPGAFGELANSRQYKMSLLYEPQNTQTSERRNARRKKSQLEGAPLGHRESDLCIEKNVFQRVEMHQLKKKPMSS